MSRHPRRTPRKEPVDETVPGTGGDLRIALAEVAPPDDQFASDIAEAIEQLADERNAPDSPG